MKVRHLLSIADLSANEVRQVLRRALQMKAQGSGPSLAGRHVALLFEKPSLRTRVTFEVGIREMGGHPFYMGQQEVGLGTREPIKDVARVLSRHVHCIVARVFAHSGLEEMARYASVPVVNALSDWEHPCQALADLHTILEKKGRLEGVRIAFIGDGNNVSRSLALGAALVGAHLVVASPQGYQLDPQTLSLAQRLAKATGGRVEQVVSPQEAAQDADVLYTDVWTSMGQEAEARQRQKAFQGYIIDSALLSLARQDAIVMHDLPAHRGEEITDEVIEGPQSVVFDQAENRRHAQKAALEFLIQQSFP